MLAQGDRIISAPTPAFAIVPGLPSADCGDWFVLRTRSRQEKILANGLRARGIGYFLPLVRTRRFYCNQQFDVEVPLFPGYLFLRGSLDDAYWADRTKRVAQIIPVVDQARLDQELQSLARVLASERPLDPYPYLVKGQAVEIRCGPLRGVRGIIEDRSKPHRLILQVSALGQAVSLEVDAAIVDLID
ncbi:transcription termination/antitermination protein NusG [Fontivita pretiosa]|uniref:transcription termination/antitermination protein NusG n=1 Tax=Fontivita pretiosa TaxID=2989684 RepID=UPI003D17847A